MTTELGFEDLVDAWVSAREPGGGPVHDYWTARFDLMCLEFDVVTTAFTEDEHSLWWFGELLAKDCLHRFGAGIYEVPKVVAAFSRHRSRQIQAVDTERSRVLREVLAALLLTIAPKAIGTTTTLEHLIELGLPKDVPDPDDYF